MKQVIISFLCVFIFTLSACKSDDGIDSEVKKVSENVLSTNATTFLKTHFQQIKTKEVNQFEPKKPNGVTYEVALNNDVLVDFDEVGNWVSVESQGKGEIPKSIIHASIISYTSKKYPTIGFNKIERNSTGYFVELMGDIDLNFDKNGEFLERLP